VRTDPEVSVSREAHECGVNVVVGVIGSKWKPSILWRLAEGDHRFGELRRGVGGITEKVLADQLRELERDGLLTRTARSGFPLRVDYALTTLGEELNDLLDPVAEWGERYALASAPVPATED
jgi:DNA-binding HxlR family transcriptional regulator